jgi:hypothetical protein
MTGGNLTLLGNMLGTPWQRRSRTGFGFDSSLSMVASVLTLGLA